MDDSEGKAVVGYVFKAHVEKIEGFPGSSEEDSDREESTEEERMERMLDNLAESSGLLIAQMKLETKTENMNAFKRFEKKNGRCIFQRI